ncbi:MAG: GNAT family N-acetyltransferase [Acidobacteriaceae bacterium]
MQNFNGDFEELARLMKWSWRDNREQPLEYPQPFLESCFRQPQASLDFAPAIYQDGALVAIGAAFPRTVRYENADLLLLLESFLTVAPTHRGKGLSSRIRTEIKTRAREQGLDGVFGFCVEGDRMNQVMEAFVPAPGQRSRCLCSIRFLALPLPDRTQVEHRPHVGPYELAKPDTFEQCAKDVLPHSDFARLWTTDAAHWQCSERYRAFGVSVSCAHGNGALTAYRMSSAGDPENMCGLIEDVLWQHLEQPQRAQLITKFLDLARANGVKLLLCPLLAYADLTAFHHAGFRRTRRSLNLYLTTWRDDLELRPVTAPYIDVT